MREFYVQLSTIEQVKDFVCTASLQNCDIHAVSDTYTCDAKSILGLFTLDLSQPILIQYRGDDVDADNFCEQIQKYTVEARKA